MKPASMLSAVALFFGATGLFAQDTDPTNWVRVGADITTDTTWTSDKEYVLDKPIFVRNGATLTIQAGTVVRGQPDNETTNPGTFNPGSLIIARGAKIQALGTAERPIIFTDMTDNNFPWSTGPIASGYATWSHTNVAKYGSLVVLGRATLSSGESSNQTYTTDVNSFDKFLAVEGVAPSAITDTGFEGTLNTCGGLDDDDDSGTIRYVSLRYGGTPTGSANSEINGLTLGAVGRRTVIEFVDVTNNVDDAIEFFGGTVNVKYFAAWAYGDDGIDLDHGWRGKMQFGFFVKGVTSDRTGGAPAGVGSGYSDKGAEMDGGFGTQDGSHPFSIPTFYNITLVGHGATSLAGGYTMGATNQAGDAGLVFRDNAGGRFYNTIVTDFGGLGAIVEDTTGSTLLDSAARANTLYSLKPNTTDATNFRPSPLAVFDLPAGVTIASLYDHDLSGRTGAFQLEVAHSVFARIGGTDFNAATSANFGEVAGDFATSLSSGFYPEGGHSGGSTGGAVLTRGPSNAIMTDLAIRSITRAVHPRGNTYPDMVTKIDPRPIDNEVMTTGFTAPADGFFTPVSFKGAFGPTSNWLLGWSTPYVLGLLETTGVSPVGVPAGDIGFRISAKVTVANTILGRTYVIEAADGPDGVFTSIGTVIGTGGTVEFYDERSANFPAQQVYRILAL